MELTPTSLMSIDALKTYLNKALEEQPLLQLAYGPTRGINGATKSGKDEKYVTAGISMKRQPKRPPYDITVSVCVYHNRMRIHLDLCVNNPIEHFEVYSYYPFAANYSTKIEVQTVPEEKRFFENILHAMNDIMDKKSYITSNLQKLE